MRFRASGRFSCFFLFTIKKPAVLGFDFFCSKKKKRKAGRFGPHPLLRQLISMFTNQNKCLKSLLNQIQSQILVRTTYVVWYRKFDNWYRIILLLLKMNNFMSPAFLGYNVNIIFLTEKFTFFASHLQIAQIRHYTYTQICGTKVGRS